MKLSKFGEKFTKETGIMQLMDDLGKAMAQGGMRSLGGGNPAHIPEVEAVWKKRLQEMLSSEGEFEATLGNYTTPQGDAQFLTAVANFFKNNYGFNITEKNVCILNGSQTTFFFLFNMLAGDFADGSFKKILLPIVPEYIGYEDQGLVDNLFVGTKPDIEFIDEHTFKYKVDFDAIQINDDIAAICVSRPTNPTGNVITDEEVAKLHQIAKQNNVPLIIDNAYGSPFPNIVSKDITPFWDENVVYINSLSKIGLPSTRTSIVIANEEIVDRLTKINAIVSLSSSTIGQRIMLPFVQDGSVRTICKDYVTPYYLKRANEAIEILQKEIDSKNPYYLHVYEGALFLWLWCKDLPITSMELYQRLKKEKVLVVPGNYFFPGHTEPWQHKNECVRISFAQSQKTVNEGLEIIAKTVNEIYGR